MCYPFLTSRGAHKWLVSTGYTGHVSELANTEIAAYMTEKGIKDNKPTIQQSEELARRILDKIEKTDNPFIKGFNQSVKTTEDFLEWGKTVQTLDKPTESVVRELHKLKGTARIPAPKGYTYLKRVPLGKTFMWLSISSLATIDYNNARADGLDTKEATLSTGIDAVNPYPVSLSDIRNAVKPYDKAFEGAKAIREGRLKEKTGIPLIDGLNEKNKQLMQLLGGEE
jgi:hypothetical protein